jgi:hypothetical protein
MDTPSRLEVTDVFMRAIFEWAEVPQNVHRQNLPFKLLTMGGDLNNILWSHYCFFVIVLIFSASLFGLYATLKTWIQSHRVYSEQKEIWKVVLTVFELKNHWSELLRVSCM